VRKSPVERLAARSREAVCFTRGLFLPCWVYTGALDPEGYSRVWVGNGKTTSSHRAAYLELIGPVPEGLEPDHLCRNRACWNPWHLDIVTHAINVQRGQAGEALRLAAAKATHCPNGHPYGDDARGDKNGWRRCPTCNRARSRRHIEKTRGPARGRPTKTHCPQGHPYNDENTYVSPSGKKNCRACRKTTSREWYRENKAASSGP
jgi:hypothetical protein